MMKMPVKEVERVLIPLDGTADSETILEYFPGLLAHPDSEALILQAFPFLSTLIELPAQMAPGSPPENSAGAESARSVASVVELLKSRGIHARGLSHLGSSAKVILETAEKEGVSMIALSTHGRSGLSHLIFGSVTEDVLERCDVPFFVVHSTGSGIRKGPKRMVQPGGWLQKILVPVTRNPVSMEILPLAIHLARRSGARIQLIHVTESKREAPAVEELLNRASSQCTEKLVPVERLVRTGPPAEEILKAAREEQVDLIAMTTQAALKGNHGLIGSVATSVLRAAAVPMLLIRGLPVNAAGAPPVEATL